MRHGIEWKINSNLWLFDDEYISHVFQRCDATRRDGSTDFSSDFNLFRRNLAAAIEREK